MNIKYLYLAIYLVILAYITWRASRREAPADFINASKKLSANDSTWTTFASLLTGYNFVLGTTFAYMYGLWYLMVFVGAALAFVFLYYFYKYKLKDLQAGHNLMSIGDYFGLKYGSGVKRYINIIFCIVLFLFLTLQIYINTQLFSTMLGTGKVITLLLTTGVVCVYLWFGGFKASVKTDIFQGVLILPIILTIFSFPISTGAVDWSLILDGHQIIFAISLAVLQFLTLIAQPESFQRVFASADKVSLKKGMFYSFVMLSAVAGAISYLGIGFKLGHTSINPSDLFTSGVIPALPAWLGSLLSVSLIAAFMGTIDSSAFALGSLIVGLRGREINGDNISLVRWTTSMGIVLTSIASIYLVSFLNSAFALISLLAIVGALIVLETAVGLMKKMIIIFLSIGILVYCLGLLFGFITADPLTSLIPIGAGLIVMFIYKKVS